MRLCSAIKKNAACGIARSGDPMSKLYAVEVAFHIRAESAEEAHTRVLEWLNNMSNTIDNFPSNMESHAIGDDVLCEDGNYVPMGYV
jgi:hypothetical protein